MSDKSPGHETDLPGKTDAERPGSGAKPDPHGDHAKGTPTSDRHAAETLAGRLAKHRPAEQKSK